MTAGERNQIREFFPEQCRPDCTLIVQYMNRYERDPESTLRAVAALGRLAEVGECEGVNADRQYLADRYFVGGNCSFRSDMAQSLYMDTEKGHGVPGEDDPAL